MGLLRALLPWLIVSTMIGSVEAGVRFYSWDVKHELRLIEAYEKEVVTINGESPGPTIEACENDIVFVRIKNWMQQNVSMHWGGTEMGGVAPSIILPGEVFTDRFVPRQLGRSQYYSNYVWQKDEGLQGVINILLPAKLPFTSHYDKSIFLDDRYYKRNYDWAAERELLLIPGKGKFDFAESTTPSSHTTACNAMNPEYSHWRVIPGTYRLNITSVTAQSTLNFQIEGHNLMVIDTDRHHLKPFVVKSLIIYPGKTYALSFKADQDPSRSYCITTNIVGQNATTPLSLAVLSYSPPAGPILNDNTSKLPPGL